jgi:hypothetical protein
MGKSESGWQKTPAMASINSLSMRERVRVRGKGWMYSTELPLIRSLTTFSLREKDLTEDQ